MRTDDSNDDLEFSDDQGDDAEAWQQLPPERDFFASPYDPPIKSLVQEIRDGELIAQPTFQRKTVWDDKRQSLFVESILLNIPIPTLFFAEDDDKTKVVVDGQQRLLALRRFLDNKFALRGLEVLGLLNGKTFDDLTEKQQRIINNRTLRCLVISAKSDSEIRFQVFERVNQGGVPLNAQEVRHCMCRGPLNDLLHTLARDRNWMGLMGRTRPHQRMIDCELILRAFAIKNALPDYRPPLKALLTDFMRKHRYANKVELKALEMSFHASVKAVHLAFPDYPFRRVTQHDGATRWDTAINRAVFDIQMITFEGMDADWLGENRSLVQSSFQSLCLNNAAFADALSKSTADKKRLQLRMRVWADELVRLGASVPNMPIIPTLPPGKHVNDA